jgi:hypothetical protein
MPSVDRFRRRLAPARQCWSQASLFLSLVANALGFELGFGEGAAR